MCIVYDCLWPYSAGGAERWYRGLAEQLAARGHDVTYLTRRQWIDGESPSFAGVEVRAVSSFSDLHGADGRRRFLPPVRFGLGIAWHLAIHGAGYDVVHTASFPFFSLLAASLVRRFRRYRLVVDWFEVWTPDYWQAYAGRLRGHIGALIQGACLRVDQAAFCFARLTEARLAENGVRVIARLEGLYSGSAEVGRPAGEPTVVSVGRLIPEKQAVSVVGAIALSRKAIPGLRAKILGDGPELARVREAIRRAGLTDEVDAPGRTTDAAVGRALADAFCLVSASRREGYGLVIVEAAARGTPSVVGLAPDNAAVELIQDGVNGIVVRDTSPEALAEGIVEVHRRSSALSASTTEWFARNATSLSLSNSVERVLAAYEHLS